MCRCVLNKRVAKAKKNEKDEKQSASRDQLAVAQEDTETQVEGE